MTAYSQLENDLVARYSSGSKSVPCDWSGHVSIRKPPGTSLLFLELQQSLVFASLDQDILRMTRNV